MQIPQGPQAVANWSELAKYTGPLPDECLFVDGGVMSNFPIDLFHIPEEVPAAPTFGVKLGNDQRRNRVNTAAGLGDLQLGAALPGPGLPGAPPGLPVPGCNGQH